MDAVFVRSQGLTSDRQRLRVHIQTQQLPIWRTRLQNAAGMSARAQCSIHITPASPGLQRVYNLFVKYGSVRRVIHLRRRRSLTPRISGAVETALYAPEVFERLSVAKRWALASTS